MLNQGNLSGDLPTENNDSSFPAPAGQPEGGLGSFESFAGIDSLGVAKEFGDVSFQIGGQTQLRQVMSASLFRLGKETLVAQKDIATEQGRFLIIGQPVIILSQGRRYMFGRMLVAVIDLNGQGKTGVAHETGMVVVGGPALLFAVQALDRGIGIQYPGAKG